MQRKHRISPKRSRSLAQPIETSASPLSVSTPRRDAVLAPCASMTLRRTGSQTPMSRHQWTSSRLTYCTLSASNTPPRTSSTKASSAKQSSCGDGPAENATRPESSSSPRIPCSRFFFAEFDWRRRTHTSCQYPPGQNVYLLNSEE